MAGSVSHDFTTIDACDLTTGWTAWGGSGLGVDAEQMKEGNGCLGVKAAAGTDVIYKTFTAITDMGDKLFMIWIMSTAPQKLDTFANGGIRVRLGTNTTNYREWWIGGSNKYRGGWECFCVNTGVAGSVADTGTYNKNSIAYMAVVFKTLSTASKNVNFWDYIHYGTGLTIYAGTSGAPGLAQNMVDYDETNKLGVLYKYEGVIFTQGKLYFGSTTQASNTYFADNPIFSFIDRLVGTNYYEIILQGKSGQTTEIYFGTKSGSAGVNGATFVAAGAAKFKVTATNADLTKFGFYACTFKNADTITFPTYNANKEVLSCQFVGCAMVVKSDALIKYTYFISAAGSAVDWTVAGAGTYMTDCFFIGCSRAIETALNTDVYFNNFTFTNNTYDVKHTGASQLIIHKVGTTPTPTYENTGGGTVSIPEAERTLTFTGLIAGSEIAVIKASDLTVLMDVENCATSENYVYTYAAGVSVNIYVIKNDYEWYAIMGYTLLDANASIPIFQRKDRNYANP